MDTEQTKNVERNEASASLPLAAGSAVKMDLRGKPLRLIPESRAFRGGDYLLNQWGQALWELLAFNPKGVRVGNPFTGEVKDITWTSVYRFYEHVTADESSPNNRDEARR